jgi:ABC-2 type transport system ATP-binding protein
MAGVLEFDRVTKEYAGFLGRRRVRALDHFSLRVEAGEIFGFLGPNGAGKTTAIHTAMGFMRPTTGHGTMLGRPFGDPLTRQRVGFLAENVALYNRSAERLVRFYGAIDGMVGPRLSRRAQEVLEVVGLHDEARRNVNRLSRGMQQRMGLAQALMNEPELLILDEPTSALDPLARVAVRELLLETRKAGRTVFLSSHLLSEIELVCDRIAVLYRGRVVRLGRTADLLESREQSQVVVTGVDVQAFPGAVARNGAIVLAVASTQQRRVLEQVWALGGEIVSVNPMRRSLEEMFLELVAENTESRDPADHA